MSWVALGDNTIYHFLKNLNHASHVKYENEQGCFKFSFFKRFELKDVHLDLQLWKFLII